MNDDSATPDDPLDEPATALDTVMRRSGRGGGPAAAVMIVIGLGGLLLGFRGVVSVAGQPWELDATSPVVESSGSECGPFTGAAYAIEIDGRRHMCRGADTKCGREGPVAVAHDPADPSRCRVARNVDRLSDYELMMVLLDCAFALVGVAGASYLRSEALRRADVVDGAPTRLGRRRRLRRLSAAALVAAVVVGNLGVLLLALGLRP